MTTLLLVVGALALAAVNGVRWLRVAQREHYIPGRVTRIAGRWLMTSPLGPALRGTRPGPLAWTRRLRTLAAVAAVLHAAATVGLVVGAGWIGALVAAVVVPVTVDAALALTAPVERRLAERWVARATDRLRAVAPTVVAITGSYGKTSTKGYVAHLLAPVRRVVATPGSFNNRAGLARSINEHLTPGTEVFVAEMGTYGPGEIAELCRFVPPRISAITAIGPVHLERFGSEDAILRAKSEIVAGAEVVVLNGDDARLRDLAGRLEGVRAVTVTGNDPLVDRAPEGAAPTNVAVALAIARELGASDEVLARQVPTLPEPAHRLTVLRGASGVAVLDDTFNSNPAGARRALAALARQPATGRRVLVTPGMYELGGRQAEENTAFAQEAAAVVSHLVVVGRTNRRALLAGAAAAAADGHSTEVVKVRDREAAVAWVREKLGADDVVLYENDHPDHLP